MTGRETHGDSPNPHRLYRNTDDGMIFGVCAGFADYFGVEKWQTRATAALFLLFFPPWAIFCYLLAAIFLPRRPQRPYRDQEEEAFWRSVTGRPDRTLSELQYTFRTLEERLANLEAKPTPGLEMRRARIDQDAVHIENDPKLLLLHISSGLRGRTGGGCNPLRAGRQ